MKRLTQIFQALLGVASLIVTTLIAAGRLAWRTISQWFTNSKLWYRLIATIGLIFAVGVVGIIFLAYYENTYGKCSWGTTVLSDNIELHKFNDHKWRLYDCRTERYISPRWSWVVEPPKGDSLAVYATKGKRGYINVNNGSIVIDAEKNNYSKAWLFSEGLAAVVKEGKIGFINAQNEVVIPFQFDYSNKCSMRDCGFLFHDGYCIMTDAEGMLGLIDRQGNWVIEARYDEIWVPNNGYRIVIDDGKFGILDSNLATRFPAEYGYINIDSDGFTLTASGKQWKIDFEGNVLIPFLCDGTYPLLYPYDYNNQTCETMYAMSDYVKYEVLNSFGIMNRLTGKVITPAIYFDIEMISADMFQVQLSGSYSYYIIDREGKIVK